MDIGIVPHQAFPSIGYAITAAGRGGRASLPVAPGLVIYSHFRHVSGTPAPEGTQGVNISKLRILDALIEQLSKMKKQSAADFGNLDGNDEQRINALIEQYQKQIKAVQSVGAYAPAAPAAGVLFNITV
ncbi:MAG: hypothetical protein FWB73_08580 [Treponema sp.]|nr:hypothetical protein [Treponema sp.]MCL2273259.1 hypothetical protein [Treponema sp.]